MKRLLYQYLNKWKSNLARKPLLLRGARQVGKTHLVRQFSKEFESFVEINLEYSKQAKEIFSRELNPKILLRDLSLLMDKPIIPGKTLLFIDEIQEEESAITSLRYFYEIMPELHIIAAGSLVDFAIEHIGLPVGRVEFLYLYPMSFLEFLKAQNLDLLATAILEQDLSIPLDNTIHNKLLFLFAEYLAIGGMPEVINSYIKYKDVKKCGSIHANLADAYKQDFRKYAKKTQIKYVEQIFNELPLFLGKVFKYSNIHGEYRKRELMPALDLLVTARIAHKVFHSSAQFLPLGVQSNLEKFKILFLDIALAQAVMGHNISQWFLNPLESIGNKGEIVESVIGQEMISYLNPIMAPNIYYWHRESRGSNAEVDYIKQFEEKIIPIEVKAGRGNALTSMRMFLESHQSSPYGIRFSSQNYSLHEKIKSVPLYASFAVLSDDKDQIREFIAK